VSQSRPATATPAVGPVPSSTAPPPPLAPDSALFLDIDGTLIELAPTPSSVQVDETIVELLPTLAIALNGAVALITGRSITDVDRLFPGLTLPIAGQHGSERRDANGTLYLHAPAWETLAKLRMLFTTFAASHPGLLLEDKGASLAIHYRQVPELADTVRRTVEQTVLRTAHGELALQPGKQLIEVRPDGRDKGTAIRDFMQERPFKGRRPVFVGDDVGDEHGFSVVRRMDGIAIKVGEGRTRAPYRLNNVADVRRWLSALLTTK
jgi:trehalose 6-phosphate phosphatase